MFSEEGHCSLAMAVFLYDEVLRIVYNISAHNANRIRKI